MEWVRWSVGFIVATMLIWVFGIFFASSPGCWEYDPTLKIYYPAKYTQYHRSEGRGWTAFGPFGLQNLTDTDTAHPPTFLLWGDSHIEAGQVPGDKTVASCFNQHQKTIGRTPRMIAWGASGASVATYVDWSAFLSSRYPSIQKHFFVLDYDDFRSRDLIWENDHTLRTSTPSIPLFAYRKLLAKLRLNVFWEFVKIAKSSMADFRVMPGPVGVTQRKTESPESDDLASPSQVRAVLALLTRQVGGASKCCIVLNSRYPKLHQGHIVEEVDPTQFKRMLMENCADLGIDVIDLRQPFSQFTKDHRTFLRGFSNTLPSRGHWNEYGHQLVCDAILGYLKQPSNSQLSQVK